MQLFDMVLLLPVVMLLCCCLLSLEASPAVRVVGNRRRQASVVRKHRGSTA